ncbi:conserved hypothetical protein [Chromobacterium violaceum ATCC 12472]|uniref:Uncharacterized protein n=1 Tax=Chromobacterium violaceum (strain ATCC 12472 / DSM 30191 / JCM 1249 / CCUG 213 / NBRC 12614 / NCIMB 9131 / NCTC 9757 / MK) TaxID=243365 RepID=Q7P0U8_CHRVO|nr:conserved hypothetical protein [Chromobacterium violaceum ATCC 12472]
MGRSHHRGAGQLALPRQDQEQQRQPQKSGAAAGLHPPTQIGAPPPPRGDLADDGPGDEPAQLDEQQQQAQRLEEHVVDQQGDRGEQHQAIQPGRPGEQDQAALAGRREALRNGVVQPQQPAPQLPARQRESARVQIGHAQPVRQQEIAVETHEGAGVDGQRGQPGGGSQQESPGAQRPFRQRAPGQRSPGRQRQFGQHARRADQQPLAAGRQLPGVVGVGVQHRHHHQEGHAHRRHPATEMAGGQRMAQFMRHLGQAQRRRDAQRGRPAAIAGKRVGKLVPAARDQRQAQQRDAGHRPPECGPEQPAAPGQQAIEPGLRPEQGNAEEQIVLQQPHRMAWPARLADAPQPVAVHRLQQLVQRQEAQQLRQIVLAQMQRGFGIDRLQHRRAAAQRPARQHLEARPAQLVITVGRRIMQHPAGRSIRQVGARVQRQFLAQRWQCAGGHATSPATAARQSTAGATRNTPAEPSRRTPARCPSAPAAAAAGRRQSGPAGGTPADCPRWPRPCKRSAAA